MDHKLIKEKIPELKRYPRYLWSIFRHGTYKKIRNALLIELEMRRGKTKLAGYPYKIIIDTCNLCNLKCRLCPTGMNTIKRPRGMMSFDIYKKILDKIKDFTLEVSLHNWGEPLLNPDIYKIIEYTAKNNIGTNLSSNLNGILDKDIDQIIKSGLEYLVVSLDGTTQDVYNKYRINGDFNQTIENIKKITLRKKRLNSKTPYIEWQFLVMKHNEHQIEEARGLADKIGVNILRFAPLGLPFENFNNRDWAKEWMPRNSKFWHLNPLKLLKQDYIINQKCFYLYRSITVNPEGSVSPCCVLYNSDYDFGNLLSNNLDEIWNNNLYQSSRALFSEDNSSYNSYTICKECQLFKKTM